MSLHWLLLGFESCTAPGKGVRLTKFGENVGRLEVCYEGYWGSVCDDIDFNTAAVACREVTSSEIVSGKLFVRF